MYNSFFGFSENPFNLTPDPRYLFLSPYHKEAIEHLLYGINERKGFIVITGGIGTGKTTLCRMLLNHLGTDTKSALIFNSFISDMELLKSINQEFGIAVGPMAETKKDFIDALNNFLLDTFGKGGNALLVIDEAQNLSHNVLEQIRMLSNLETAKEKLIQIVLVGQPELEGLLASPSLRQLNERIMVRYNLRPLTSKDIRGYVEHRMSVAGGRGDPSFTKGAVKNIYLYSRGNPRRINNVCDRALLIAYVMGKHDISNDIIKKAVRELAGNNGVMSERGRTWERRVSYTFLLLLLIITAGFGGWRYREGLFKTAAVDDIQSAAPLFLDEQKSLSTLFSIFYGEREIENPDEEKYRPSLVSYDINAEYYVTLKRPFRVFVSGPGSSSKYLVIKKTGEEGATVIDANGDERAIDRNFIISHWGRQVSWVYPSPKKDSILFKGVSTPNVLELQRILADMGYMAKTTGIYDQFTFQELMRFQKEFGLKIDGIAGPRTMALLYQMVR